MIVETLGYSSTQVCELVGVTYRQLDYWGRTQLVVPSITDAHGSGSRRRYSTADLYRLTMVKKMLDAGLNLQSVRAALRAYEMNGCLLADYLIVHNGRAHLIGTLADLNNFLITNQCAFVWSLRP